MEILTGEQMRRVDRRAIEEMGIPGLRLMEAAGRGVAEALLDDYPDARTRGVVILCGKGNNGGDGLVAARSLARRSVRPQLVVLTRGDELEGDAGHNYRAARAAGLEIREIDVDEPWDAAAGLLSRNRIVLDAMLGTGVRGGARGRVADVIERLNRADCRVAAVDVPSGIDADSTQIPGPAVAAERTYTLCRPKLALVQGYASELCGRWRVIPIGIPDQAVRAEAAELEWLDRKAAAALLAPRRLDTHKGSYGHLLAVAGSRGKSGAAVLVARGALRAGVGLVTVATAISNQRHVAVQQAELMTEPLPDDERGSLADGAAAAGLELLSQRDALAIGPGLGQSAATRRAVVEIVRGGQTPAVIDADGLNALAAAGLDALLAERRASIVLTPHPGEAARLLGCLTAEIQNDRLDAVRRLARTSGAVVVLKGHRTLIADAAGRISINSSGNPGMATAGTGDVLTGMIGSFLARGMSAWDAARLAVYAHGDAGDRAAARLGREALMAGDVVDMLPGALASMESVP